MKIESYFIALLLTLIIELSVVYLIGFRDKKSLLSVVCVNIISHPILCYILWINMALMLFKVNFFSVIILEIIVVILEAILLTFALRKRFITMLMISFAMNFISFVAGLLIFKNTF